MHPKLRICLVTSANERCGIREYGNYLVAEVNKDANFEIVQHYNPDATSLGLPECDIIHLNHHAALHSNWTAEMVEEYRKQGYIVTVTQHDTYETFAIMQERGFTDFRKADGLVVHEPVEGLTDVHTDDWSPNVWEIPQGVLPAPKSLPVTKKTLGTVGFDLPWKNYNLLAEITKDAGWVLLLLAPGMAEERVAEIKEINPSAMVVTMWLSAEEVVEMLGICTATAFLYSTGNSGTSGAIRLGIAARRPLIAFKSRQNRDLTNESAISWVQNRDEAKKALHAITYVSGWEEMYVQELKALAEQQSWTNSAEKYKKMWIEAWTRR